MAQLVARNVRNVEVRGSNPLCSTGWKSESDESGSDFSISQATVEHKEMATAPQSSRFWNNLWHLCKQIIGFGIVGLLAFFIDYTLFAFLYKIIGIHYLIAAVISFCVSLAFNYAASMRYVFRHKSDMTRRREVILFFVGAVIGLGINEIMLYVGDVVFRIDPLITKILATVVVAVWNFVTRKIFLDSRESES